MIQIATAAHNGNVRGTYGAPAYSGNVRGNEGTPAENVNFRRNEDEENQGSNSDGPGRASLAWRWSGAIVG